MERGSGENVGEVENYVSIEGCMLWERMSDCQ